MAETRTTQLCYAAMGLAGGRYCAPEAYDEELCRKRKVVKPQLITGMSIFGKTVTLDYGYEREADLESRAFGIGWCEEVQELLDMLRRNQVSGQKLVVQLE